MKERMKNFSFSSSALLLKNAKYYPFYPFLLFMLLLFTAFVTYWKHICLAPIVSHFPVLNTFFLNFFWFRWYLSFTAWLKTHVFLTCILCVIFSILLCFFFSEFLTTKVCIYIQYLTTGEDPLDVFIYVQLVFLSSCIFFKGRDLPMLSTSFMPHTLPWAHRI